MMLKRMIVVVVSLLLFSCNYPQNDEIVGDWNVAMYETQEEAEKWGSVFPGYIGKCSQRPDFYQFASDGFFQSTIVGANCVDSIIQTGIWELDKKNLKIHFYHNDLTISAKIIKHTNDRLIFRTINVKTMGNVEPKTVLWRKD